MVHRSRRLLAALFLVVGGTPAALAGPGVVGNGGDAVRCATVTGSPFTGIYSLDYLLTYQTRDGNADIVQVFTWDESYRRISSLLATRDADLAYSFEEFVSQMDNFADWTQPKIWREAGFGLVRIDDQNIIRKLPINCYQVHDATSIDIVQTVVQTQRPDAIVYEYDPKVYEEFKQFAPLQFSFLMVHEWLWELTGDVRVIRDVDRFLHTQDAGRLTPEKFRQAILNIGLDLSAKTFVSVCDRTEAMRDAIIAKVGKPCETIGQEDVMFQSQPQRWGVQAVKLDGLPFKSFASGDFSGLGNVFDIQVTHTGLEHLADHQFDDILQLRTLTLSNNRLAALPSRVLLNKPDLRVVDVSGNALEAAPIELFQLLDGPLCTLELSSNRLKELPNLDGIAVYLGTHLYCEHDTVVIDLSHNELSELPVGLCTVFGQMRLDLRGNPLSSGAQRQIKTECAANGRAHLDID